MPNQIRFSIFLLPLLFSSITFGQRTQAGDTIDTDVVNVVKPYTPSLSDAFKIKETPRLTDSVTSVKKEVRYNIFSIPVASTFTPAKGKAATVTKDAPQRIYDNYASAGFGSYTTILGEVYLNHELSNTESVGGYLSHHSSQGGIDEVILDDSFSKTSLNANYSSQGRNMHWNIDGGGDFSSYNWYGIPPNNEFILTNPDFDVSHSFYSAHIGGEIDFFDSFLESANVRFRRFGDNQGSGENRLQISTSLEVPIQDKNISTTFYLDYLNGGFDRSYFVDQELNYGNMNFGIAPSYQLKRDDLTVNLGVELIFLRDLETDDNNFYIYPNITASYRLLEDAVIGFAGVEGGLIQNSYHGLATENPFVSPTLFIIPTDQQYNGYLGIKGKLSNNLGYTISGRYKAERAKALFKSNAQRSSLEPRKYELGNSFGIVYDDVSTFSAFGELNVDVNRNFKLRINAEYFGYNTDEQEEPWNLPDVTASLFLDYQISKHWFAGGGLYYVGERKDQWSREGSLIPGESLTTTVTLDSYFDANAHVGYKIFDYLSVFAKANNIVGESYQKWLNYPVQGLQIMAGATYQFDF